VYFGPVFCSHFSRLTFHRGNPVAKERSTSALQYHNACEVCLRTRTMYVLFFLQNAGELRFIILRRKLGQEPVTTLHKLNTLWFTFAHVTKRGDHTMKTQSKHPKYLGLEQSRGSNPELQLGTKSCDPPQPTSKPWTCFVLHPQKHICFGDSIGSKTPR
jgi:hypothetical protein